MFLRTGAHAPKALLERRRRGDPTARLVRLSDYRGRWVVLFADGHEADAYEELRREFGSEDAIVLGVCRDGDDRFNYPVLADRVGELGLGRIGTALIDPRGVVQHVAAGEPAERTLDVLRRLTATADAA
jgi:hypothetical protein